RIFEVIHIEQNAGEGPVRSPYSFERPGGSSLPDHGYGRPSRNCGLVRCGFRPSDDMVCFPFLVPANAMLSVALRDLCLLLVALHLDALAADALAISGEIVAALEIHAVVRHPVHGEIWAYEVDGFGGTHLMDDANVPSLLSLPYLGFCNYDDPRYLRTRAFCLSPDNPHFVSGPAGIGIGSPHTGPGTIWPMSWIMQALTAIDEAEILACLAQLKASHAGTGFIHESLNADDSASFTRPWFAWANTLFGELIVTLSQNHPSTLHPHENP
ncbi:MAG: glycoside hydrolase family 125 protein, partial [Luteolibacter sp.]